MKKVGIITMHKVVNYGSALQAYALQRVIEKLGYDCEIIDYVYPNKYGGLPMDLYYVSYDGENISQAEVEKFIGLLFRIVHSDVAVRDW